MTGIGRSTVFVRSVSGLAVATALLSPAVAGAQSQPGGADATNAQPGADRPVAQLSSADEIVVTGIRASLNRAIDIKRNSAGVVDAISAEDIGKFPDTNLAESLQRITGVSINRVNGEGSQVAVRGFSGAFNLVTLNGRQMPASNVDTSNAAAFARGSSRSFDFQNLASEGVSTLEVYKTGRATVPSGGIGAAVNIVTRRPLDAREAGLSGSIGAKALYDNSVEDAEAKKRRATPEVSGLLNWTNEDDTFGALVFGSYQLRHSASVSSNPNYWNIVPTAAFFAAGSPFITPSTVITNRPTNAAFVQIANDSRYALSENRRERINGQAVLQFRPSDSLELTIDGLYASNRLREQRNEQTNWFNRPFSRVTFDSATFPTAIFLAETLNPTKDEGFEQQQLATFTELKAVGGNARWNLLDNLTLTLDGQHATSTSRPDNKNGTSATLMTIGAPVIASHTLDFSTGFPQQSQTINDCVKGNCNNILDKPDLGSQVARTIAARQSTRIDQAKLELGWDLGEGSRFDVGGNWIDTRMNSRSRQTTQTLGDWGITDTGLVNQLAGDLVNAYCLTCKFDKFNPNSTGSNQVAFRGNAIDILDIIGPYYAQRGRAVGQSGNVNDTVNEETWAVYGQLTWSGEIGGRRANALIGARYEQTRVKSVALQAVPTAIFWASDNDFFSIVPSNTTPVEGRGKYSNLLPAVDFNIEVIDNVKARASFSRTLARADFNNLFASAAAMGPNRPTALGGLPTGSSQNPALLPLLSDNFDVSLEWYYKPASFVSIGFFDKRVRNFIGTGISTQNLFGLRDPSSGAAGSRSGTALAQLRSGGFDLTDVNLFTYTALLVQANGNVATADARFRANYANGALNQTFVDTILAQVDITGDNTDPLYNFNVSRPLNNREGKIHGFEMAWTHFFGDSGIGFAASYTKVDGNVNVDPFADPTVNIFALTGLGDSANGTIIYDKNGLSARLSYNWRAKFLAATNQGPNRNPLFVAPFGSLDANISYDLTDRIALSLEGINLTSESLRQFARTKTNLVFAQELKPRFLFGARYRF